jgi:integrase/recombinase XerD
MPPFRKGDPPPNKGRRYPPEPLTPNEVQGVLAQCPPTPAGARDRALIVIMWRCGLRIAEALALRLADVDHDRREVRVLHGKGDKFRVVGIGPAALAVLDRWLESRHGAMPAFPAAPIFTTMAGGPMTANHARVMLKRRAAAAGIGKRVSCHSLRHSHALELADRGVPVHRIQRQLGHSSLATTDVYLRHIAPADVIAIGHEDPWAG